ncbi:MAG: hypothetical protein ACU0GG_14420 [Paracoccaceae bacterium]
MKDIGPNPHLNKLAAILVGFFAVFPLYFGFDTLTFLPRDEWGLSAVLIAIGGLILGSAAVLWRRRPMNAASIRFRDGGFVLETRQVFRGEKNYDLDWSDITEIIKISGGLYVGRSFQLVFAEGARRALFAPAWTDTDSLVILKRLKESAHQAGFKLEKLSGFWRSLTKERWKVQPLP